MEIKGSFNVPFAWNGMETERFATPTLSISNLQALQKMFAISVL